MTTKGSTRSTGTGGKARKAAKGTGPQRGGVVSVGYADPEKAAQYRKGMADALEQRVPPGPLCPVPDDDERVAIRLLGYPYLFTVRVRAGRTGPVITHLEVTGDYGAEVGYEVVRRIPFRRIAISAHAWLQRGGGTVGFAGDHELQHRRPDDPEAARLYELLWRVEAAIASGEPVRKTVAAEMGLGTATIDRLIRKAKDAGLMDGIEIPQAARTTTTRCRDGCPPHRAAP